MILKVNLTPTNQILPFDYMNKMVGFIHNVLGENNDYHDSFSNYQISPLKNGKFIKEKNGLSFNHKPFFYIASLDNEFLINFINNIKNKTNFIFNMNVINIEPVSNDESKINKINENTYIIPVLSGVLLKENINNKTKYYTYKDDDKITSNKMKSILLKASKINNVKISENDFEIYFDQSYKNKKTKLEKIKNINNIVSVCPIIIKTKKEELINLIRNFGIGQSRGCGFGYVL